MRVVGKAVDKGQRYGYGTIPVPTSSKTGPVANQGQARRQPTSPNASTGHIFSISYKFSPTYWNDTCERAQDLTGDPKNFHPAPDLADSGDGVEVGLCAACPSTDPHAQPLYRPTFSTYWDWADWTVFGPSQRSGAGSDCQGQGGFYWRDSCKVVEAERRKQQRST